MGNRRTNTRSRHEHSGTIATIFTSGTIQKVLSPTGPVLVDVLTNLEEVSVPPELSMVQAWGFAIAKSKEFIESA